MEDTQSQQTGEYFEDTEETEGYDSTQQRVRIVRIDHAIGISTYRG